MKGCHASTSLCSVKDMMVTYSVDIIPRVKHLMTHKTTWLVVVYKIIIFSNVHFATGARDLINYNRSLSITNLSLDTVA